MARPATARVIVLWLLVALARPAFAAPEPGLHVVVFEAAAQAAQAEGLANALRLYTKDVPCRVSLRGWPGTPDEALSSARREGAAYALWLDGPGKPDAIEVHRLVPKVDHRVPVSPDDLKMGFTTAALRIRAFVVAQGRTEPPPAAAPEPPAEPAPAPPTPVQSPPEPPSVDAMPVPAPPTAAASVAPVVAPAVVPARESETATPRAPAQLLVDARAGVSLDPWPAFAGAARGTWWPWRGLGLGGEAGGGGRKASHLALDVSWRWSWGEWMLWAGPRAEARIERTRAGSNVGPAVGAFASVAWRFASSYSLVGSLSGVGLRIPATTSETRDGRPAPARWSAVVEAGIGLGWEAF